MRTQTRKNIQLLNSFLPSHINADTGLTNIARVCTNLTPDKMHGWLWEWNLRYAGTFIISVRDFNHLTTPDSFTLGRFVFFLTFLAVCFVEFHRFFRNARILLANFLKHPIPAAMSGRYMSLFNYVEHALYGDKVQRVVGGWLDSSCFWMNFSTSPHCMTSYMNIKR